MLFSEVFLFSKKTPLFENVGDHKDNNMNMQMYYSPDVVSFPYFKQVPPPTPPLSPTKGAVYFANDMYRQKCFCMIDNDKH